MSERYPTGDDDERERAVAAASLAIQRGDLVIVPTDTVYGIAADAFDSDAVEALLDAKERSRDMPVPVLVSSATTLDALAVKVPAWARALVEELWPGPLTLVCHQQTSLKWDLGDTRGTVALRMPDHPVTLAILERTGPLAVSSANLTGRPAATDAAGAEAMLGEDVDVVVDAGPTPGTVASTIVDATGDAPRVLRQGVISRARLLQVLEPLGVALEAGEDDEEDPAGSPPASAASVPAGPIEPEPEPAAVPASPEAPLATSYDAVGDPDSVWAMQDQPPSTRPIGTDPTVTDPTVADPATDAAPSKPSGTDPVVTSAEDLAAAEDEPREEDLPPQPPSTTG